MDPRQFTNRLTGKLVATIEGQKAFVPAPLPPEIALGDIAVSLSCAMQAIGELKGACRRLQNPFILVRPLQRQEALTSSAMEGTYTTDDNLLLAEAGIDVVDDESTREVVNYLRALNECLTLLEKLPISHRVLRRAHSLLLAGLSSSRGAKKRPGEYKKEQNWIGGRTIDKARYVPPPAPETQKCMDELERYINRQEVCVPYPLIDLALVHYQLEAVHPFADGNGRVGRMLISLMAVHSKLLDKPVLYVSPVMERYKDEYIDLMLSVSTKGNWIPWLNFFFDRVTESCQETVQTVDRLIDLQVEYRSIAGNIGRSAAIIKLVDMLFEKPAITVTDAAQRLGVTYPAAKSSMDKLVAKGLLTIREDIYPRIYVAHGIARASRPPEANHDRPASGRSVTTTRRGQTVAGR